MTTTKPNISKAKTTSTDRGASTDRGSATEAAILGAAKDMLAAGGLESLSMRSVAERVGVTATAIYRHFSGKEELVSRVVREGYLRFGAYLQAAANKHQPGSSARVMALGAGYIRFAFENEAYFRILFNIQTDPRDLGDLPGGGGYDLLKQSIVDAMEAGAFAPRDPDLAAHFFWMSVHGLVTLRMACDTGNEACGDIHVPNDPEELFAAYRPLLLDGLRGRNVGPTKTQAALKG